jgi:hypothetical protein
MCVSWSFFRFCHLLIVLLDLRRKKFEYKKKVFFSLLSLKFERIFWEICIVRGQQNRTFFSFTFFSIRNPAWSYIKIEAYAWLQGKLSSCMTHKAAKNLWNYNRRDRNWWRSDIKTHKFTHTRLTYKIVPII